MFDMIKSMETRLTNAENGVVPGIVKQPDINVQNVSNDNNSGNNNFIIAMARDVENRDYGTYKTNFYKHL